MALKRRLKILDCDTSAGPMQDTALKVAFASTDMKHVNQHFGSARSFAIYAVNPERTELIEAAQFGDLSQDGNEDKLSSRSSPRAYSRSRYTKAASSATCWRICRPR